MYLAFLLGMFRVRVNVCVQFKMTINNKLKSKNDLSFYFILWQMINLRNALITTQDHTTYV